jgi:hypothetical protein
MDEYYRDAGGGLGGLGGVSGSVTAPSGTPAFAVPETPEDAQILHRLESYPAEIRGRVLATRQGLADRQGEGLASMATPMPDINDMDLINMINSVKV